MGGHQVGRPQERGQPGIGGPGVDLLRAAGLGHPAVAQHGHLVRERDRLLLVVGDQHDRGLRGPQHPHDVGPDADPQGRVQGRERLVQQDHRWADRQGPGQGHPLLLAARQFVRVAPAEAGQADQLQQFRDPGRAPLAPAQPERDVARHRQVREQRRLLRDVTDPAALGRHVRTRAGHHPARQPDLAGLRPLEAGQDPQQRGLAAARRAEDGGHRPRRHDQVHLVQDRGGAEAHRDPCGLQRRGISRGGHAATAADGPPVRRENQVATTMLGMAAMTMMTAAYGAAAPYAVLLW